MLSPIVYCGPMWGGKTEALISRLVRARIQNVRVMAFQPARNVRDGDRIRAHSGASFPAIPVKEAHEIVQHGVDADVIGIDEVFMIDGIVDVVKQLVALRKKVVLATLDMDSDGNVWESVGQLLGMAQEIEKCPAVCSRCKHDAYYTFRRAGAPNERVLVGAGDIYEPRCYTCFSLGQEEKRRGLAQTTFFDTRPVLPG